MNFYAHRRPRQLIAAISRAPREFDALLNIMNWPKKTLSAALIDLLDREYVVQSSVGYMLTHKGMDFLKSDCYACPHAGEKLCCGGAV